MGATIETTDGHAPLTVTGSLEVEPVHCHLFPRHGEDSTLRLGQPVGGVALFGSAFAEPEPAARRPVFAHTSRPV